jgi:hypothetical protein
MIIKTAIIISIIILTVYSVRAVDDGDDLRIVRSVDDDDDLARLVAAATSKRKKSSNCANAGFE